LDWQDSSTSIGDFQTQQVPSLYFQEADILLGLALENIAEGQAGGVSSTIRVCGLLRDLLEGARVPLQRLGRVGKAVLSSDQRPLIGATCRQEETAR
jgi:hypothetical protein